MRKKIQKNFYQEKTNNSAIAPSHLWFFHLPKGTSINDVWFFFSYLTSLPPKVRFLPYNLRFFGVILGPSPSKSDIINGRSLNWSECFSLSATYYAYSVQLLHKQNDYYKYIHTNPYDPLTKKELKRQNKQTNPPINNCVFDSSSLYNTILYTECRNMPNKCHFCIITSLVNNFTNTSAILSHLVFQIGFFDKF